MKLRYLELIGGKFTANRQFSKVGNYDVIVMSYMGYLYLFWYVCKEKNMVLTTHTSGDYFFFKFIGQQPSFVIARLD